MQKIADWLESLGMSEYAQRFAENDIDCTILSDLTDQDLKDIGVASLGHRRKLLRAIATFGDPPVASPATSLEAAPPPAPVAPPAVLPSQDTAGERRYLTVMFCDLVGSTAISAQLDVEEWRDLVGAYLDAASAAVTEMGGHVAKKLGDGILALFGYPVAHENDAERAARAALSIQRALVTLNSKNGAGKPELKARIGLETGAAIVDAAGEIYGDVANVAARVQAQAEPSAVLITSRVQRQIAGLFVAEDRGAHALKGVPEATVLFRLVRASGGGRRIGQRQLTPLVGRDDEMTILQRRWQRARGGRRSIGAHRRRAWLGQVAPDRGIPHAAFRNATHLGGMELFAASPEHAAASDRRMGPAALRWRRRTGGASACGPGKLTRPSEARAARDGAASCPASRYAPDQGAHAYSIGRGIAPTAIGRTD